MRMSSAPKGFLSGTTWLLGVSCAWFAVWAGAQTATFDFDTGQPSLTTGQNVPLDQSSGGVTAHFSAIAGGLSVQDRSSTSLSLSEFSGKYLYPNVIGSTLLIRFSQDITNLVMTFATSEQTPIENPTPFRLVAYTNSTSTPPVGSSTVAGKYFGGNTLPMGTNSFSSTTPFNVVTLQVLAGGATGFLIDNLTVKVSGGNRYTIQTSASPAAGGVTTGAGAYLAGATVTVEATPNPDYEFVNWTENDIPVSTTTLYQFTANSFRSLVANFLPTWTITTHASPATDGCTSGDGVYLDGTVVGVLATPAPGFGFVNWTENDIPVSTSESYLFVARSNRTVLANFAPACSISTSSSSAASGATSGGGTYVVGSPVSVVATPKTGYAFVNWTENGVPASTEAAYRFTSNGNRTLMANFTPTASSATFDFDTGTPTLSIAQTTPFDQTSGGLTAHFSSTNAAAFSIQNAAGSGWKLSKFSGNYLAPNVLMSVLDIQFSQPITSITLSFATLDFQDILIPSPLELTAYAVSAATPPVGTASATGTYTPGDTMPMSAVSFHSATPFNLVRIAVPPTATGTMEFIVDNIVVQTSAVVPPPVLQSAGSAAGPFADDATATVNGAQKTITIPAKPGDQFYRLRSSTSTRIAQIQTNGGQVILTYESL